jgi:hypothetical protein
MPFFLRLSMHCLLAVALVTGSVSTLAGGFVHGAAPEGARAEAADGPAGATPGDCHAAQEAVAPSSADSTPHDCCDDAEDCQHDNCNCVCPALSLVVPSRLSPNQHLATVVGQSRSFPPSPLHRSETPLRPPQA